MRILKKPENIGAGSWRYTRARIRYSLKITTVFKGQWNRWLPAHTARVDDNVNVPVLNSNGAKRDLNLNWWDNDWPDNWRLLSVRYVPRFSSFSGGVFC